jgi:glycosyltransferase involved in cell wall biosynthesis
MGYYPGESGFDAPLPTRDERPLIVIGITHPQTCLVLTGRLRALRESGFRVVLIASPGALLDAMAAQEGVEALAIPMERGIAPLADLVSLIRLVNVLLRLRPDIAEFSTPKAGLLGGLAGLICGVPRRVYLLRGLRLETASGLKRSVLRVTERLAAACSHLVLCNSPSLRDQALKLHLAVEHKVRLLGHGTSNGVDVDRFAPGPTNLRLHLGIPECAPVIGYVGRLTRDKGVPELIQAFDALLMTVPDATLLLVGWFDKSEDALSPELRRRIDRHPSIVRTGFVTDTAPYYRALDIMVLPTWREGFPNVVLEAAATGIPVITTLATGSRDAVVPEVTGLLIPPGYPEAITEAMLQLLRDPLRRRQMGVAARKWVMERFRHTRVHALTVSLFEDLLQAQGELNVPVETRGAAVGAD